MDDDLYAGLTVDHNTHRVAELEMEVNAMRQELLEKNALIDSLQAMVENLQSNVSCLYLTASQELKRRDMQLSSLKMKPSR